MASKGIATGRPEAGTESAGERKGLAKGRSGDGPATARGGQGGAEGKVRGAQSKRGRAARGRQGEGKARWRATRKLHERARATQWQGPRTTKNASGIANTERRGPRRQSPGLARGR